MLTALLLPAVISRTVYTYGDLGNFHLPLRTFYAESLADGDNFTWWPDLFCGYYIHGEGQGGLYHPFHLLIYKTLPLDIAFNLEVFVNYPVIFLGLFLCLRRWGLSSGSSSLGAFTFAFSGPVFLRFNHINAVAVLAHLPWLLILIDIAVRGNGSTSRRYSLIGIALLTGSQLLLGFPQSLWFSLLAEAAYIVFLVFSYGGVVSSLRIVAYKLIGVLLGGIQIWPTLQALQSSLRIEARHNFLEIVGHNFLAMGSLHPVNYLQLLFPYIFRQGIYPGREAWEMHEYGIYMGSVPILLCVALFFCRKTLVPLRPIIAYAFTLFLLSALLALGAYSPLFPFLRDVPLLGLFRVSARYMVLAALSLSILAAIASHALLQNRHRSSNSDNGQKISGFETGLLFIAGCSFLIAALAAISFRIFFDQEPSILASILARSISVASLFSGLILLIVPIAIIIAWSRDFYPRVMLFLLVTFHVLDISVFSLSFVALGGSYQARGHPIYADTLQMPLEDDMISGVNDYRVAGPGSTFNRLILQDIKLATGYVGLPPKKNLNYQERAACRLAGVKLFWDGQEWAWIEDPLPPAWIGDCTSRKVPEVRTESDSENLLAGELVCCYPRNTPGEDVQIVKRSNAQITIKVKAKKSGMLVVTESYHPGWKIKVDGDSVSASRVCGDFLGCQVTEGSHTVILNFWPGDLVLGLLLTIVGLCTITCILFTDIVCWLRRLSLTGMSHGSLAVKLIRDDGKK